MGVTKCGKPQCNSDGDRRTGGDATDRLVGDEVITLMITLMISLFRRDDLIIADLISACHRRDAFRRSRHLERVIPALVNVRHSQLLFKQMPSFVLNGEVVGGKKKNSTSVLATELGAQFPPCLLWKQEKTGSEGRASHFPPVDSILIP